MKFIALYAAGSAHDGVTRSRLMTFTDAGWHLMAHGLKVPASPTGGVACHFFYTLNLSICALICGMFVGRYFMR